MIFISIYEYIDDKKIKIESCDLRNNDFLFLYINEFDYMFFMIIFYLNFYNLS